MGAFVSIPFVWFSCLCNAAFRFPFPFFAELPIDDTLFISFVNRLKNETKKRRMLIGPSSSSRVMQWKDRFHSATQNQTTNANHISPNRVYAYERDACRVGSNSLQPGHHARAEGISVLRTIDSWVNVISYQIIYSFPPSLIRWICVERCTHRNAIASTTSD